MSIRKPGPSAPERPDIEAQFFTARDQNPALFVRPKENFMPPPDLLLSAPRRPLSTARV
jgi:hypothetical protein